MLIPSFVGPLCLSACVEGQKYHAFALFRAVTMLSSVSTRLATCRNLFGHVSDVVRLSGCLFVCRTSKMSYLAVLLLVYRQSLPAFVSDGLFGVLVLCFVVIKLVILLRGVDLLWHGEKHICYVLFGGLVDDLQQLWETWHAEQEENDLSRQR